MPSKTFHTLCAQASELLALGRNAEAVDVLFRAVAANPDDARPHNLLAQAYLNEAKYSMAIESANRAINLEPDNEWSHRLRALALLETKKKRQALESAREAVRLAPELLDPLHVLAICLCDNGKAKEANEVVAEMLRVAPDVSLSHYTAGYVTQHAGQLADAAQHYQRALSVDPENWEAMNNLGLTLDKLGRRQEAIEMFHNAARLRPNEQISRANLKNTVGSYVGGGLGVAYLVIQVVRVLAQSAGDETKREASYVVLPLAVCVLAYCAWRRKKRMSELHASVRLFYEVERRRDRRISAGKYGRAALVAATAIPLFLWSIIAMTDGADIAGLNSAAVLVYISLWAALIAEIVWLWRAKSSRLQ
jgi:tetratricopeptide (TPR) repeat protein